MLDGPAIVIPAAGASTRFGSPKQLAPMQDGAMLRTIVLRALEVGRGPVTVVVGAHAEQIRPLLEDMPVSTVINDGWQEGLGSSVCAGIRSLSGVSAALIWLGDQVGVTVEDLQRLIAAWDEDRTRMVASLYTATIGVPAIFPSRAFAQLLALRGDQGAKGILLSDPERTTLVEMPNAAIDIDVPDDLENFTVSLD